MAGEFKAGSGRIEITGDSSGAVDASKKAGSALEELGKNARANLGLISKAMGFVLIPLGVANRLVAFIKDMHELAGAAERTRMTFSKMNEEFRITLGLTASQAIGLESLEKQLRVINEQQAKQTAAINETADAKIQEIRIESMAAKAKRAAVGGESEADIEQQRQRSLESARNQAESARRKARLDEVASLREEARKIEEMNMTAEQREERRRAGLLERVEQLRKQNRSEAEREELESISRIISTRAQKEKESKSQSLDLVSLARAFDTSARSAADGTTRAVKGLRLSSTGGGPGIKD